jgi:hypothetical protein
VREDHRIAFALELKDFLNEIDAECGHWKYLGLRR